MFTFKEVLCLLTIVVAYGIAGQLDYDDEISERSKGCDELFRDFGPSTEPELSMGVIETSRTEDHVKTDFENVGLPVACGSRWR